MAVADRASSVTAACALVGDSTTDVEAAHAICAATIAYANKPGKTERLAGADAVITSMAELLDALAAERATPT